MTKVLILIAYAKVGSQDGVCVFMYLSTVVFWTQVKVNPSLTLQGEMIYSTDVHRKLKQNIDASTDVKSIVDKVVKYYTLCLIDANRFERHIRTRIRAGCLPVGDLRAVCCLYVEAYVNCMICNNEYINYTGECFMDKPACIINGNYKDLLVREAWLQDIRITHETPFAPTHGEFQYAPNINGRFSRYVRYIPDGIEKSIGDVGPDLTSVAIVLDAQLVCETSKYITDLNHVFSKHANSTSSYLAINDTLLVKPLSKLITCVYLSEILSQYRQRILVERFSNWAGAGYFDSDAGILLPKLGFQLQDRRHVEGARCIVNREPNGLYCEDVTDKYHVL